MASSRGQPGRGARTGFGLDSQRFARHPGDLGALAGRKGCTGHGRRTTTRRFAVERGPASAVRPCRRTVARSPDVHFQPRWRRARLWRRGPAGSRTGPGWRRTRRDRTRPCSGRALPRRGRRPLCRPPGDADASRGSDDGGGTTASPWRWRHGFESRTGLASRPGQRHVPERPSLSVSLGRAGRGTRARGR
jgi:hypothetical protein